MIVSKFLYCLPLVKSIFCEVSNIKEESCIIGNVKITNLRPGYYDQEIIIHSLGEDIFKKKSFSHKDIEYVEAVLHKIQCYCQVYLLNNNSSLIINVIEPDKIIFINNLANPYNVSKDIAKKIDSIEKNAMDRLFSSISLENLNKDLTMLNITLGKKFIVKRDSILQFLPITIEEEKIYIRKVIYHNVPKNLLHFIKNRNIFVQELSLLKQGLETFTEHYHVLGNTNNQDLEVIKLALMEKGYFNSYIDKKVFFYNKNEAVVIYNINIGNFFDHKNLSVFINSKSINNTKKLKILFNNILKNNPKHLFNKNRINTILKDTDYMCKELYISIVGNKVHLHMDLEYTFILQPKIEVIFYNNFPIANKYLNKYLEKNNCFIGDTYNEGKMFGILKKIEEKIGTPVSHDKNECGKNININIFTSGQPQIFEYFGDNIFVANFKALEINPIKFKWNKIFNNLSLFTIQPKLKVNFQNTFPQNIEIGLLNKLEYDNFLFTTLDVMYNFGITFSIIGFLNDLVANNIDKYNKYLQCETSMKFNQKITDNLNTSYEIRYNNGHNNSIQNIINGNKDNTNHLFTFEIPINYSYDYLDNSHSLLLQPMISGSNNSLSLKNNSFDGIVLKSFYHFNKTIDDISLSSSVFLHCSPKYSHGLVLNEKHITNTFLSNATEFSKNLLGVRNMATLKILDSMRLVNMPVFSLEAGGFFNVALCDQFNVKKVLNTYKDTKQQWENLQNNIVFISTLGIIIYLCILKIINIGISVGIEFINGSFQFTWGIVFFLLPTTPQNNFLKSIM